MTGASTNGIGVMRARIVSRQYWHCVEAARDVDFRDARSL
jgi:hypothetical protein